MMLTKHSKQRAMASCDHDVEEKKTKEAEEYVIKTESGGKLSGR